MMKKTMKTVSKIAILGFVLWHLSACTSTSGVGSSQGLVTEQQGYQYDTRGTDSYGYDQNSDFDGQNVNNSGALGTSSDRIIYFEFDSSSVRADARPVIEAHARYLVSNPGAAVILEGHTDERGTREYNIGLGDQRGSAVRQIMVAQGVSPQQISVVSYGEERPLAAGQDEYSYAQNRRVEIVY